MRKDEFNHLRIDYVRLRTSTLEKLKTNLMKGSQYSSYSCIPSHSVQPAALDVEPPLVTELAEVGGCRALIGAIGKRLITAITVLRHLPTFVLCSS